MAIPLDRLLAVRKIVCHRNKDSPCPDGVASALVLRDVLPKAEVAFVSHDDLATVAVAPGILFCDISPDEERAEAFLREGAIVLDHHKSAACVARVFAGYDFGAYADEKEEPGVSGAVLAFRDVWLRLAYRGNARPAHHPREGFLRNDVERFASVAGVRDTWQTNSPLWRASCEQAEALRFWPWASWPGGFGTKLHEMLAIGAVLVEKNHERDVRLVASGYRFETPLGRRVLVIPTTETSDVAEMVGADADVVVGFAYHADVSNRPHVRLSLRSRTDFDCAKFCARYPGGGGHTRAAGCSFPLAHLAGGAAPNPYAMIERALADAE